MRLAIVCPEYRTDLGGEGGLAAVVDFLVGIAERHDWRTQVYSPRMSRLAPESRSLRRPVSWLRPLGVTYRPDGVINVGASVAEFEPTRYLPRRWLDHEMDRHDVVIVVAGSPAAVTVARRTRRPVVLQVATMAGVERQRSLTAARGARRMFARWTTRLVGRMDRRGFRVPEFVLVENAWMLDQAERNAASRVVLAPPGVNTDAFAPGAAYAADGPIVMVARLADARKDYSTLFRAYAHARADGLTSPLVLAGRGSLLPQDQAVLDELGLRDRVEVRSDVSMNDLVDLLRGASLFAFSSSEEGLGISIVEAMACGLPVVSTATEGAKFVLEDPAVGELVPVGDPVALGEAMVRWMGDLALRQSASTNARKRAVEVFSIPAAEKLFVDVITAAVGQGTSWRAR